MLIKSEIMVWVVSIRPKLKTDYNHVIWTRRGFERVDSAAGAYLIYGLPINMQID